MLRWVLGEAVLRLYVVQWLLLLLLVVFLLAASGCGGPLGPATLVRALDLVIVGLGVSVVDATSASVLIAVGLPVLPVSVRVTVVSATAWLLVLLPIASLASGGSRARACFAPDGSAS
jgi:hypothetical protein